MNISKSMKHNVISIPVTSTVREAASVFVENHIGLLPIVDQDNKLVGVVGLRNLLSLELPDFVRFIEDVDFVHDFGAVETTRPSAKVLDKSIESLMEPAISVEEDAGLLRAYALMLKHNLQDIPVVSIDGKLTGLASRVDIGIAVLASWHKAD